MTVLIVKTNGNSLGRINNLQDSLPQNVEVLISTEPATSEDFCLLSE